MNCRASPSSVAGAIEALLRARADVNVETDEASTPLLAALQHRNMAAVEALCKAEVKFVSEILDEVKTLSETSRRHRFEEVLRPIVRGNASRRLPLWLWVQDGMAAAVDALLRGEEQVDADTLVALQRCRGDPASRKQIEAHLRQHLGSPEFTRLHAAAAGQRLLQELREAYDDRRGVSLDTIRETLAQGAEANAHEEDSNDFEENAGGYSLSALQLLVTNTHTSPECMHEAVSVLVESRADVNMHVGDSPLLSAVQHRCIAGVEALSHHSVKVTSEVLEELKNIAGDHARRRIEDILQPLIDRDKSLRCPLWIWVQFGGATAVEALLRNAAHDEEVDADVMMALQRCRGNEDARQSIQEHIREHVGDEEFRRLEVVAATRRLLSELREAHTEERDLDVKIVHDTLQHGANPNAREEEDDGDENDDEDAEEDDEGEGEDEEEDEGDEEEEDDESRSTPDVED